MSHTIQSLTSLHGVYLDNITVDGKNHLIEYTIASDHYIYENIDNVVIAQLDINEILIPKILSKGVFEIKDKVTNKSISIQFYKSTPFEIKNTTEFD